MADSIFSGAPSALDQYYQQQNNPVVDNSTMPAPTDAPTVAPLQAQYQTDNPQSQQSYGDNALRGFTKALQAPLPITGFEPPEHLQYLIDKNKNYKRAADEEINQQFPNAADTPLGHIIERGTEGVALGAPFGVAGAVSGAISGATTGAINQYWPGHPLAAEGAGLVTGMVGAPIISNLAEFGAKAARSVPEMFGIGSSRVNSLYKDIGAGTAFGEKARVAGANDSWTSLMQTQNALRSGLGGAGQISETEQHLFGLIQNRATQLADNLGPNLTHQELGEAIQGAAHLRADQIKSEIGAMSTALNNVVPKQTEVFPMHFIDRMNQLGRGKYPGAPELEKIFQNNNLDNTLTATWTDVFNSPNMALQYDVLKNIRTDIGEGIQKGIFNPDANVKELRSLYQALTRDMESAYHNTTNLQGLRAFRAVSSAQEALFDKLEKTVQPLIKVGLDPETITTRLLAQANKGSSRIDDITSQLNNVDPGIRDMVMGYVLRNMGEGPQKNFNPATFYGNWQKLSPEAKALYPKAQQEGIERLAQLSGLVANSFEGANRSHTSDSYSILERVGSAVRGLTQAAAMGIGAGGAHIAGQEPIVGAGVGYGMGQFAASTIGESTISRVLAALWTSRPFNIWLATEAPNLKPDKLAVSLGALAGQAPEIADGLNYISKYMGLSSGANPKGFAEGGVVEGDPSIIDKFYDLQGIPFRFSQLIQRSPSDETRDILYRHKDFGLSPLEIYMKHEPSFDEGEIIPNERMNDTHRAFQEESKATERKNSGAGRDDPLNNSLWEQYDQKYENVPIKMTSGGPIEANENEPPGSLIDMIMHGHNVIPMKSGSKGATSGVQYDILNDGGNRGYVRKVNPNGTPSEDTTLWLTNDAQPMPRPSNTNTKLPPQEHSDIDDLSKMAFPPKYSQGGSVDDRIIGMESRNDPNAKNPRSSASGLGQFIDSTWVNLMRKYHPEVSDALSLKNNPQLSKEMVSKYSSENAQYLQSKGIAPDGTSLYLAHFLGPGGAVRVLSSNGDAPVSSMFNPQVMAANPFLKNMTTSDLVSYVSHKMGGTSRDMSSTVHQTSNVEPHQEYTNNGQGMEDLPQDITEVNPNQDLLDSILNAAHVEPLTKFAAREILKG